MDINEDAPELTIGERIEKYHGTEANQRLDTEDLDGDYELNNINRYIEYRISLADSAVVDNRRDFSPAHQDPQSGWRMYRIPLTQVDNSVGGIVNLSHLNHLRMWFRGVAPGDTLDLQVAGLDFVAADSTAKPVMRLP